MSAFFAVAIPFKLSAAKSSGFFIFGSLTSARRTTFSQK